jgi:hypothetical protein
MKAPKVVPLWRYSLRWSLPHLPCPGPKELFAIEVPAGRECPDEIEALWRPGTGYAGCIDFEWQPIKRWTDARRAAARRRNLQRRIEKVAPLFADELIARELHDRADYFAGKHHLFDRDRDKPAPSPHNSD